MTCDGTASCGGVVCQTGDELQGTFTDVGRFVVGAGTTVFVASGAPLAIYASTISIQGTIDGTGRGKPGGSGGNTAASGINGFGGSATGTGGGIRGVYGVLPSTRAGGGGGAYGGIGGSGAGAGGGTGGAVYGSTGTDVSPISPDDIQPGSGGGGGTGGDTANNGSGGAGGSGGASVYFEASSITISGAGSVLLNGAAGATVADNSSTSGHPGAGGGGSGGGLLIRVPGFLELSGAGSLSAAGAGGGNVNSLLGGTLDPGGGGGGGRIKIFFNGGPGVAIALSTAAGAAGAKGAGGVGTFDAGGSPVPGSSGTISFGLIASSPTGAGIGGVFITSIAWAWNAAAPTNAFWGDAPASSRLFRIFPSTAIAPYPNPQSTAAANLNSATESGLMPNTTYYRLITSFTDWGDSLPSTIISTHTSANTPGAAGAVFTSIASSGVTVNWAAGNPANPNYTVYSVERATDVAFSQPSISFLTALSSSPTGLAINATYYFRVRAVNLDGVASPYTAAFSTATLAVTPSAPTPTAVFITSASFNWTSLGNPNYTPYAVEISTDNFFTLAATTMTLGTQSTFTNLNPGTPYYVRVKATNLNSVDSAYTAVVSTTPLPPGVSSAAASASPTVAPGAPQPVSLFSYDGTAVFNWTPAQSPFGILRYFLDIGTLPGANDFISGLNAGNSLSYTAANLLSGKTYYARVRAESNAGVVSENSPPSPGVNVFITAQQSSFDHPFSWPNPFDPSRGPANIGLSLGGPADVTLKIYTLGGALVYQITRHFDAPGNQVMAWAGTNDSGMRAAPGGYLVTIRKAYADRTDNQKFKLAVLY